MNLAGVPDHEPAYWTEWDERGERLIIRIRRGWKAVRDAALGFAATALLPLLYHWSKESIDWEAETLQLALPALIFIPSLIVNLFARELVTLDRGELVHRWEIAQLGKSRRYRQSEIRLLGVNEGYAPAENGVFVNPLKDFGKLGAVRFNVQDNAVFLGASLDSAEAYQVVLWLTRRLPRGAEGL